MRPLNSKVVSHSLLVSQSPDLLENNVIQKSPKSLNATRDFKIVGTAWLLGNGGFGSRCGDDGGVLRRLLRGVVGFLRVPLLLEAFDTPGGIDELLASRIEGVAMRTDVD